MVALICCIPGDVDAFSSSLKVALLLAFQTILTVPWRVHAVLDLVAALQELHFSSVEFEFLPRKFHRYGFLGYTIIPIYDQQSTVSLDSIIAFLYIPHGFVLKHSHADCKGSSVY